MIPAAGQVRTLAATVEAGTIEQVGFGESKGEESDCKSYHRDIFRIEELVGDDRRERCPFYKPRDEGEDHPYVFQENLREVAMTGGVIQVAKTLSESSSAALVKVCEEFQSVFSFTGKLGECIVARH